MSQIRIPSLALGLLLSLSLFLLSGCGDKNSQADLNPTTGKHPSSWVPSGHKTAAKQRLEGCTECHGSDFSGGISLVACTTCHLGNEEAIHPITSDPTNLSVKQTWGKYAYALHAPYVRQNGTAGCATASCHGTDLLGVSGSGPSCKSCHADVASVHPVEWTVRLTHSPGGVATVLPDHGKWATANGYATCRNVVCHGSQGQGVFLSGPACVACHDSSY